MPLAVTRRRLLSALTVLLLPLAGRWSDAVAEAGWLPDRQTIDQIEAAIVMPAGAEPLASYARAYGGEIEQGRRVLWGVFQLRSLAPGAGAITLLDRRPLSLIQDGGCSVITLKFDVLSRRIVSIQCNGEA
jgi:hypothetical protein